MRYRRHHHGATGLAGLAGGVAHEFNNLLGAIQGFASLIVDDTGKDSIAGQHAARIIDASRSGLDVVEQIAVIAGYGGIRRRLFGLSDLLEEVVGEFAAISPIRLRLQIERHTPSVMIEGDRSLIRRALVNLCLNAAEALRQGDGVIDVSVQPAGLDPSIAGWLPRLAGNAAASGVCVFQDGEANWVAGCTLCDDIAECVSVVVADNGTGMGGDILSRAFDPFFSTRERALHSGLGLAFVQGVARAHGGGVIVDTAPGRGTTVRMIIPLSGG